MSNELTEQKLGATLRSHLSLELDGQLGQAEQAFRAHLDLVHPGAVAAEAGPPAAWSRATRTRLWFVGVVGTAVAASIATMWALPVAPPDSGPPVAMATQPSDDSGEIVAADASPTADASEHRQNDAPQWEQVERLVNSLTVDRGPVVLEDNTPGRLVRRVALEETEWVDERRGVRVRAVVPREDVQLISLDTY